MPNQKQSTNVNSLQTVITEMDSLSQEGFSEIAAVARLTIKALESDTCNNPIDDVVSILGVIWGKANDYENLINSEAENVGCNHMSESLKRKIKEAMGVNNHE